jgi:MoaA/NifB/PqqE/SkfB family radical SAM enzyme
MTLFAKVHSWFTPHRPLAQEMLHYQTPPDAAEQYRLHLRIEKDGRGLLVVNAATVLHLNQTAAEYARLFLRGVPEEEAVRTITRRYRVGAVQARADYRRLREQVVTLATAVDVAPDIYVDSRVEPFSAETSAPYRVDIALTYRIDESGTLDGEARRRVDRELTAAEWQKAMNRLWQVGVPHVCFTGGEPTLRQDLVDLVRHAEGLGMVSGLLTDGRRLRDIGYLDALLQAGLDHLQITLISHLPEVHDRLTGQPGSWEEAMAGLRNAIAGDIYLVVHLVISPDNAATATETVNYLAGLGVHAVALSSPLRAVSEEQRAALQAAMAAAQDAAHARSLTVVWNLAAPYSHANPVELEAGLAPEQVARQYLYLEPDGDVLPTQGYNVVLGNILRDPWEAIWENPARKF